MNFTAYKVGRMTNAVLEEQGLKPIPTQMVYRYMDQKLIPTVEVEGQRLIPEADAVAWIAKYVERRMVKAAEAYCAAVEAASEVVDVG